MSSIGQALGGIVGAAVGFFTPMGALYGAQIGMSLGGLLDPPKGPTGPRLSDLSVQTSTYGAFIPRPYVTVPVVGNVFWLLNDKLTETKKVTGGKGGPEMTSFVYSATFSVGLCEGPIAGITRIWVGPDLFYDANASDVEAIFASNQAAEGFTLYLGTDDQLPDPLMQADKGDANVPAHRGLAYLVFHDLPLEKYGNSLMAAQVKVEVVTLGSYAVPDLISDTPFGRDLDYSADRYISSALNMSEDGILNIFQNNARLYLSGDALVYRFFSSDNSYKQDAIFTPSHDGSHIQGWSDTPMMMTCSSGGTLTAQNQGGEVIFEVVGTDLALANSNVDYCQRGRLRLMLIEETSSSRIHDISDGIWYAAVITTTTAATYGAIHCIFIGETLIYTFSRTNQFVAYDRDWNVQWVVDMSSTSISVLATTGGEDAIIREKRDGVAVLRWTNYFWQVEEIGYTYYGAASGLNSAYEENGGHHLLNDMWISFNSRNVDYAPNKSSVSIVKLTELTPNTGVLSDIVEAECLKSGLLESSDIDVTSLTDVVRGYRISSPGTIRAGIDPLRAVWPFDVRQHGYTIEFVRRGGSAVATIPAEDLAAVSAGSERGISITDSREMDTVLPRQVTLRYFDHVREYDISEQSVSRSSVDTVNQINTDLAIVMNAQEARQTASMQLYLYWLERNSISFVLPPSYQQLEPADVVTVTATDATYSVRLTSGNYLPDGRTEWSGRYEQAAIYTQVTVADEGQSTGATLGLSGPTEYDILDVPLLQDEFDAPGYIAAMCGHFSGWPGGILFRSVDDGASWGELVGATPPGAVIGFATNYLSTHLGTTYDKASTLAVELYSGELSSVTEAQMLAGHNWFAYGADGRWEIISAQNCVLQVDGSYVLSDFIRGYKGTEWATGLHAAYDRLVLLDYDALAFVPTNSATIGFQYDYRAVTVGKTLDSEASYAWTYAGVNLKPLSPCALTGSRHPSTNDWTLSWTRRSRFGEWRNNIDAPLGEASEGYWVEVYSSGTYATLKSYQIVTAQTATYTSAQQVTDFGSNQSTLYLKIYQMSETAGLGYPLTTSITR